jgi:hypothetical protein
MRNRSRIALYIGLLLITYLIGINLQPRAQIHTRYVHPDGLCGDITPCHRTIAAALALAQPGETITVQASITESLTGVGAARIILQGVPGVRIDGGLNMYDLDGWTIRDLTFSGGVIVHDPRTALTIRDNHAEAIYVIGTRDLTADLTITGNTLPGIFDFPTRTSEISILGADGMALGGTYEIADNRGVGALNIFTYVREGGHAALNADILVRDNGIVNSANLGITRRGDQRGAGAINGDITFERNTVHTPIMGLNVTVDGAGTRGDIHGNMIFRDNVSDKIAVITIDSLGGAMHGDFIATGNRGERIEFGIKGDCTSRTVQIERNELTWKGSPENTVITVRAQAFSEDTTIRVADNRAARGRSDGFGVVVMTYTGANDAYTQIDNNQTFFIVYQIARASKSGVMITRNRVQTGDPLRTEYDGALTVLIGEGDLHRANITDNRTHTLNIDIATRLLGTLSVLRNDVAGAFTLTTGGVVGPGVAELRGNSFGGAIRVGRTNIEARFNRFAGNRISVDLGGKFDARDNWWGCNAVTCQPPIKLERGATAITTPFLVFNTRLTCTASDQKIVVLADLMRNSAGETLSQNETVAAIPVSVGGNYYALEVVRGWGSLALPDSGQPIRVGLGRESRTLNGACNHRPERIGVYRPDDGGFYLQTSAGVKSIYFGAAGLLPVTGDWNGDGIDEPGVFDKTFPGFRLQGVKEFAFGAAGDLPLAGRWDAAMMHDGVGVLRASSGVIYLRRALSNGAPDYQIALGIPDDLPLAGDWDGDGIDGIALFRPSEGRLYLLNRADVRGAVTVDAQFAFGQLGDRPVAGDMSGQSAIGMFRNGALFWQDGRDTIVFGTSGDVPLMGRWGD